MKIIASLILSLMVCQTAFAARVKYNIVTGDIISMAETNDNEVATNEALLDVETEVKSDIEKYKVDENGEFRLKTTEELNADKAVKDQEKANRKSKKKAVLEKLGLTKQEFKALLDLIDDRTDD